MSKQSPGSIRKRNRANGGSFVLPPVLVRELRAALHRPGARKSRSQVARFGVIGVSLLMLVGPAMGMARWGATLNFYLLLA